MTEKNPKVGIIGIGMVGAPIARYFQEIKGYKRKKNLFLYDTDLQKSYFDDVGRADVIFVALPTPRDPKTGACDTSIVSDAIKKINGDQEKIIVIKSTVPPGTTDKLQTQYPNYKLLFNPEFLTESRAWEDMMRPDRQIVGFTDKSLEAAHLVLSLLPKAPFMSPWGVNTYQQTRITATEAEFIKYASNVYFARKINWANALANTAEKLGVDYENIRQGMAADHRIGDSHLDVYHGGYRGFGGYCFPKDLSAFMMFAKNLGMDNLHDLLKSDWKFNEALLHTQGLTIDDVSRHITELELSAKRQKKD
jgi:UDPglucose 6-dehydrogenase